MAETRDEPAALLTVTDPKIAAAALTAGGRLDSTQLTETGRLSFRFTGLPSDFLTRLMNDEVQVSARSFISSMESVMNLIAEHQRRRR
jgi:hypothetical protein